jgi:U3 small nucleolar RNA-associated protein 5
MKRYTEASATTVAAMDIPEDEDAVNQTADLDVDMAEMSLGQRLTALNGPDPARRREADSDSERDDNAREQGDAVPAGSLTRTLTQALHSSDSRLLETCLSHSDPRLVQNTVRRLPQQLAVPLIHACTERLARGKRGAAMKGRGAGSGAGAQRGAAMIGWIRAVLAVHGAHLMTMPDLVTRLAGLHATLSSRLALQESLLGLSGRLDMVLRQIELRSEAGPAQLASKPGSGINGVGKKTKEVRRYVEGESEDEDEDEDMDVAIEEGDDNGSIEDVALGGFSDEEEDDEEEDESESEDDDDEGDSDEPALNSFIDDEAEEWSDEDDEDESD